KPSVTNEGTGAKLGVPDVTDEESTKSKVESWGKDEDDSNNDHYSRSEGGDQESDSGDDNTQSDKEKWSNSEHDTDDSETGSESDQEENEEEIEDDEEEKDYEFVKTPSNSTDDEDETNVESKVENKAEGDEDKEMDYATNQFDDDMVVRLNEPVNTDEQFIQQEGAEAKMINVHQGNENLEITLNQVNEDAHVTISTAIKKTEVPVTSSSHSSNLASKFLKFSDIPHTDAKIISPMDVHVHHEVLSNQTPTLLTVLVSVIMESSLVFTTVIPQSLPSFTPLPPQSTPTPPPTTKATNPLSALPNIASDGLLNIQVTSLVDEHLDSRLGATIDEFMSYLSTSITARITDMVTESLEHAILSKESSQPKSAYEAAALLKEFELKKILIDKMDEIQSYLTATKHRECYDGLIKSYDLDKSLFTTYDKVYSLKRSQKDKDKDEDPFAGSDRGLKKRKTSKDAEPTKDSNMPQDQEKNLGNDDEEPKGKVASKRDWFTKPKQPQEPIDPDWNVIKTPQQGPTQSWLMTLASSANKPSKTFDELMSTPIERPEDHQSDSRNPITANIQTSQRNTYQFC
ncbi:hypothetical protein Tco_1266988, partial [Tanacetum coccineum]